MLNVLHIENIAVIEKADISFDAGLNVLTGETGAGKSIVIDALSAVLGSRTSRELIRTGSQSASVGAVFSGLSKPVAAWLIDNGFPEPEDDELSVTRDIQIDGRNSCRLNGRVATVAQLRELGMLLISISGQNDSYSLLGEHTHLAHLDRFAGLSADEYRAVYDSWLILLREIESLKIDDSEKAKRIDTMQTAIDEIEDAELEAGEEAELLARRILLKNGVMLMQSVENAYFELYEDDDSVCTRLSRASNALQTAAGVSDTVSELVNRIEQLSFTAEDISGELGSLLSDFDFSPEEQDEVESRLTLITRLTRKYGGTVESALEYLEKSREELDKIVFYEQRLEKLYIKEKVAYKQVIAEAKKLTKARVTAAKALQISITEQLSQLDMGKVRFEAEITTDYDSLSASGAETVRFLISTNLGEPLKPIAKIASGGELARIMLALKNVLSGSDDVQTLVFDEVDSGVSGRAAQKVAEKLSDVAREKQVLSVTHLSQIAAMADCHFHIEKGVVGERTVTSVHRLDYTGQVEEIARIIGGASITETTLKSASELIDAGKLYKIKE